MRRPILLLASLVACSRPPAPTTSASATPAASVDPPAIASAVASASATAAQEPTPAPDSVFALPSDSSCSSDVRCLIEHAYAKDADAKAVALALFDETGDVAGTDHEQTMDGGFRGTLHLLPELPTGAARAQLGWVASSARDFDAFFKYLEAAFPRYRWQKLTFRFFRSESGPKGHEVQRTTPSAYAIGPRRPPRDPSDDIAFSLGYNVKGSLLMTETGVRETLFHEVFHMNDAAHGDWSLRTLTADYDAVVKRCGAMNVACLRPYAPNDTMVRGGTYYAFEPNNGMPVREYAAELALRWYKEHRALWKKQPSMPRFKCGPAENRRAWDALVKEFFAGVDRTPPCP